MEQVSNRVETMISDKDVVARVLGGDSEAFGIIIRKTEALVAQIVGRMADLAADREDLAQDIYLKAYHRLGNFRFESKLSTWIGQIAYNTCYSYLERKKRIKMDFHGSNPGPGEEIFPEGTLQRHDLPENLLFRKQSQEIVRAELDSLNPVYKTLLVLYHQEDLGYEEIAGICNLPLGTVKSYMFRARKTLRERILQKYKMEEL
jgi:RNA polymerase sigma factor (sigma-70 family)